MSSNPDSAAKPESITKDSKLQSGYIIYLPVKSIIYKNKWSTLPISYIYKKVYIIILLRKIN